MKKEEVIKERLDNLRESIRLNDLGIVTIARYERIRYLREIEFLEWVLK